MRCRRSQITFLHAVISGLSLSGELRYNQKQSFRLNSYITSISFPSPIAFLFVVAKMAMDLVLGKYKKLLMLEHHVQQKKVIAKDRKPGGLNSESARPLILSCRQISP